MTTEDTESTEITEARSAIRAGLCDLCIFLWGFCDFLFGKSFNRLDNPPRVCAGQGGGVARSCGHAVTFAMLFLASGCAAMPGTLVARQDPNAFPTAGTAPQAGAYGLFVAGESEPLFAFKLQQGEKLGFEQATAGTISNLQILYVYAVYGDRRFRLDSSKSYEWRWLYAKGP